LGRRGHYRGKWAGLNAVVISKLMGVKLSKCKRYLYQLAPEDATNISIIGRLIQLVRNKEDLNEIKRRGF